jgi:hypothetical protein
MHTYTSSKIVVFWVITQRLAITRYRRPGQPVGLTTRSVVTQKSAVLTCFAVETWNQTSFLFYMIRRDLVQVERVMYVISDSAGVCSTAAGG